MDEEFEIQRAPTPQAPEGEFEIQRYQPPKEQTFVDRARPITPRRMGEFLEQRMLPSLEEGQRRSELGRAERESSARMETSGLSDIQRKALAATGRASEAATAGLFPWAAGAAAKGLGTVRVPGYERYATMPFSEAKKEAEKKISAAATLEPGYGLAGTGAGIVGGAAMLPAIAPTRGPAISGGLTGAAYGSVSGLAQEGDFKDALKGAIIGGAAGAVAAPIIERAASGLTRLFVGGKPVIDRSGNLTPEALKVARNAGLDDETINAIQPQLRSTFEARGLTPAAAREAQFKEFGIDPTRGMVGGATKDLSREASYADFGKFAEQASLAAGSATKGAPTIREAVGDALSAGTTKAAQMRKAYEDTYKAAENVKGSFSRDSITNIGDNIRKQFASNPETLRFYTNEAAEKSAKEVDSVLGKAIDVAPGVSVVHRTFRSVEEGRKILNEALGKATNNADRAAVRALIEKFDDRIEQNINNGAFSGDKSVVDQWRQARKLFSDYQNKFGIKKTGEEAGRLMRQVLDGTKSADDVGNMMFNFASTGDATLKREAVKTFMQLRRALGPNSPELNTIKESYIRQIMTPTTKGESITPKDFNKVAGQIDDMLKGRGADFSRRLLTGEERSMLARYANVMRMAGRQSPEEIGKKLDTLKNVAMTAAPMVASGASYALAAASPVTAGIIGAVTAIPGAVKAASTLPPIQRYLANRPPKSVGRPYRHPSVRTGMPLAAGEVPETLENAPAAFEKFQESQTVSPEERVGRKSGGRVIDHESEAEKLILLAEKAKNSHSKTTEQFLSHDDKSIIKALEIANKDL